MRSRAALISLKNMEEDKKIEQPDIKLQELLDSVISDEPTDFVFMGKKHSLGWMKNGTMRKFTHVNLKDKNEYRRNVKLCAIVLLNNVWKLRFFYWIYWRYLYYFREVDAADILRVMDVSKKKIPSIAYSLATILATGMTDVMMQLTKDEAKAIRAERHGEEPSV